MTTLWNDAKYAIRMLAKAPGFTAVAMLTLAIGIGANTAIFSVIHSVLLQPLPYPQSEQLVQIFETFPNEDRNAVSGGAFKDWRDNGSKLAHVAVYEETQRNLTGGGVPQRVSGLMVSSEFLPVLGIKPVIGRGFAAGEDTVGGDSRVMVLAHAFWQDRFGSNPSILGAHVSLDQAPYTIVGVLGPDALLQDDAQFLVPDVIDAPGTNWSRAGHWRQVIGRMAPGVTASEVQAELRGVKQRLNAEYPEFKKDCSVAVFPMQEIYAGGARPTLMVLLGAVTLVLFIACANVSNLLLARGHSRSREMAVRLALGAPSWRIIRQMLTESALLAGAGCAIGLLLAMLGVRLLAGLVAGMVPQVLYPHLEVKVLLFSLCVAAACAVLSGVLPAWRASRPDLNGDLKETERGAVSAAKRRSQSALVVSEFALTLVLLVGAGLFLRSFMHLLDTDPGFNPRRTLAFDLSFPDTKYPQDADRLGFIQALSERIAAIPGVESVGASSSLPFSLRGRSEQVSRMDRPPRTDYVVACDFVSRDYFAATGISLVRGRVIADADNRVGAARVAVIDTRIATELYPEEDAIGQRLRFLGEAWEIVGIVAPVRQYFLDYAPRQQIYVPQSYSAAAASIVLRTGLDPLALSQVLRKTILDVDPDQPMGNVRTLENDIHRSLASKRATLVLLDLFAAIAVGLSCMGIYGVMSYSTGQRTHEFCIRSALGAQGRDILRLVLLAGMKVSLTGIGVGVVGALILVRLMQSQLFEIRAYDPWVFAGAMVLLALVAGVSIYLPARKAARVDPMQALRCE
jgi:predicted permease